MKTFLLILVLVSLQNMARANSVESSALAESTSQEQSQIKECMEEMGGDDAENLSACIQDTLGDVHN
jgi:hypothetical protein